MPTTSTRCGATSAAISAGTCCARITKPVIGMRRGSFNQPRAVSVRRGRDLGLVAYSELTLKWSQINLFARLTARCGRWDSAVEGRFTGIIWQRWSEGLFSPVVVYAVDSATAHIQNGIASEADPKNGGAKGREAPYGEKFMRRRRARKHVAHRQLPGRSSVARELV
jgi:hypothetical protein